MTGRDILLRCARVEEASALGELCVRSKAVWGYDAAFLEACREELRPAPADIERGCVVVAEVGGVVAGVAEVSVSDGTADLKKLFVEPDFIGRGVGEHLMAWVLAEAASRGARDIVIESDPGAANFYRRFGARDAGIAPSGSIPGRTLPRLVLALDSAAAPERTA
jgi:GNAT superfamily N-acetyltransferase